MVRPCARPFSITPSSDPDDDLNEPQTYRPLEAHAPPQHLILNVHNSTVPEIPCVLSARLRFVVRVLVL